MDSHNIGRGRQSIKVALSAIKANTLVIGIENDVLFPVQEQEFIASHIPGAKYHLVNSTYGHDGFLIETQALTALISTFLKESANKKIIKLIHTA